MLLGSAADYFAIFGTLNNSIDVQTVDVRQVKQASIRDGVSLHYPPKHCHQSVQIKKETKLFLSNFYVCLKTRQHLSI